MCHLQEGVIYNLWNWLLSLFLQEHEKLTWHLVMQMVKDKTVQAQGQSTQYNHRKKTPFIVPK